VLLGAVGLVAVVVGGLVGLVPVLGVAIPLLLAGGIVVAISLQNPLVATCLVVSSFYFEGYLSTGIGLVTPAKVIGLLPLAALVLSWTARGQRLVRNVEMYCLAGLVAVILLSSTLAVDLNRAMVTSIRYVSFFLLYVVLVNVVDGSERRARWIVDSVVIAACLASLIGLIGFLSGATDRANGPLVDPNDFGFMLASAVPLVVYRLVRPRHTWHRVPIAVGLVLVFGCAAATFSRGAFVGLAVTLVWLLLTRRVRIRSMAVIALTALVIIAGGQRVFGGIVETALEHKQSIAGANTASRLEAWAVALEEWHTSPALGVGPGNFETRYTEHSVPFEVPDAGAPTTHNAYLNVLAELGLAGFILFMTYLGLSWRRARTRPGAGEDDMLATAIAASIVCSLAAAAFLTEQFYAPLWLFPGLYASLPWARAVTMPRVDRLEKAFRERPFAGQVG
jgi:O-antigen ligase